MRVGDVMSKHPVHISSDATVFAALNLLKDMDFRHLPVVDGGQLCGILSDKDLKSLSAHDLETAYYADSEKDLNAKLLDRVASLMNPNVFFVNPESSIVEAIDVMTDQKVGAVPVVDLDNSLVGIVSYVDILREAAKLF
jgi:CBS domain-containing protein